MTSKHSDSRNGFIILSAIFFMWGFLTSLNGILLPHISIIFELEYSKAMLVYMTFFGTYFIMAFPAGKLINALGYRTGIMIGLVTAGFACTILGPAATLKSYPLFLTGLFLLATGITTLQVASLPYIALIGFHQSAASRLTLKGAFNSLGTTLAPLFGTTVFLALAGLTPEKMELMSPDEYKNAEVMFIQLPYLIFAAILFGLAFIMEFSELPKFHSNEDEPTAADGGNHKYVLQFRHLALAAVGIFFYVGAEVTIGSYLVGYLTNPDIVGIDYMKATQFVAFYWGGAMIGRFIGHSLLKKYHVGTSVAISAAMAILLLTISMLTKGDIAMYTILSVGIFNAILFPAIFTMGIDGLGKFSEEGSSVLVMAIVGGAVIPFLFGLLADKNVLGLHYALILPVVCYLYIIYYGLIGSKFERIPA